MLYKKQESDELVWAVWRVDESIEQLQAMLGYAVDDLNLKRLKERLAIRVLLKSILGENHTIRYKESGKPYLENGEHISITHTKGYVAISLSKTRETGIDIEAISDRVTRIKERFVADEEKIDSEQELTHLLIHWSAKEAIFKLVDAEVNNLRNDFILSPFTPSDEGVFEITDTRSKQIYSGQYFVEKDFVLTVI